MLQNETDSLSANQRRAIVYLVQEPTVTAAAESTGVKRTTLYRWLDQPEFQSAYRAARREVFGHAIAKLQRVASSAADVLSELMQDKEAPPGVRLGAARAVLDVAAGGTVDDVAAEVEDLRRALSEAGG